jgi:hypothetical protein
MSQRAAFLNHLAYHALQEDQVQRAVASLQEAVGIWTCLYGSEHWQTKAGAMDLQRAQQLAASTKDRKEMYAEAVRQFKIVHEWRDKESAPPEKPPQSAVGAPPKKDGAAKERGTFTRRFRPWRRPCGRTRRSSAEGTWKARWPNWRCCIRTVGITAGPRNT